MPLNDMGYYHYSPQKILSVLGQILNVISGSAGGSYDPK